MEDNKNCRSVIRDVRINANNAFIGITHIFSEGTINLVVEQLINEVIKEIIKDDLKSSLQAVYKKHENKGKA